jgi:hypothetical protein
MHFRDDLKLCQEDLLGRIFSGQMISHDGVVGAGDVGNWKIEYQLTYAKLVRIRRYDKMIRSLPITVIFTMICGFSRSPLTGGEHSCCLHASHDLYILY